MALCPDCRTVIPCHCHLTPETTVTEPLTTQQFDEYQALTDAATPGPWHHTPATDADVTRISSDTGTIARVASPANAAFVAAARTAVPALLAELHRLRAQNRVLVRSLKAKDARTGDGDKRLREFLTAGADQEDGDALAEMRGTIARLRTELAAAVQRDITSPLAAIVKHGEMSDTVRREISDLLADAAAEPAAARPAATTQDDQP